MKLALCDDNQDFLNELSSQIDSLSLELDVKRLYSNFDKLLWDIDEIRYDVIFMDIDLNEKRNGMDIAEEIYKKSPQTKIIFCTGSIAYSQQVHLRNTDVSGFIHKPVDEKLLLAYLSKIAGERDIQAPKLAIKNRDKTITIDYKDIYYIESESPYVMIHTRNDGRSIKLRYKLGEIAKKLPQSFFQCHQSIIVNFKYVRRVDKGCVVLENDKTVDTSRALHNKTKKAFFDYMEKLA